METQDSSLPTSTAPVCPRPYWSLWRKIPLALVLLLGGGYLALHGAAELLAAWQDNHFVREERQQRIQRLRAEVEPMGQELAYSIVGTYSETRFTASAAATRISANPRIENLLQETFRIVQQIDFVEAEIKHSEQAARKIGWTGASLLGGLGILVFTYIMFLHVIPRDSESEMHGRLHSITPLSGTSKPSGPC
jgi:hypothetical protein